MTEIQFNSIVVKCIKYIVKN